MPVILIHGPHRRCRECTELLAGEGHDVVVCSDRETLLDAVAMRRLDVLVYVLSHLASDVGLLSMLRRVGPRLPIILLGVPAGLTARRRFQEMRPTYYGVFPLEPSELRDAVRGALSNRSGRSLASERSVLPPASLRYSGHVVRTRRAASGHRPPDGTAARRSRSRTA